MDGSTEGGEPVRRTRSGRLANTPKPGPKSKRTPVRGKKASSQVEQQDSDEEQQQLDNSDNEESNVVITTEEEAALLEDNSATDNILGEEEAVVAEDVVGEDSNSVTNDFNSFKGAAESSSEHMGDDTNSFDVEQGNSGEGNGKGDVDDEENGKNNIDDEESDSKEPVVFKLIDEDVEMPYDESPITNGLNPENPNDSEKQTAAAPSSRTATADPEAENISEEDIPDQEDDMKVEGEEKVVPEAEEVSDEELPGPKRAELPADTEVVSEDELPTVKGKGAKEGNKGKRKLAEGDYDPGSPTSESESAPSKKPALSEDGDKEEDEEPEKPKKLPELDKYWKAVNDDPTDFTGWTYLLQYVDQENDMEAAREAYDAFLSHYPYCYGYWRKYADYEKRKGNKKKCEEVFERGLKSIPLSVDLWIHYLTYVRASRPALPPPPDATATAVDATEESDAATETVVATAAVTSDDAGGGGGEEYIRSQFERSLGACGLEFRSDRLWEHYIKWECEGKRAGHAMRLYERLLVTPTQGYMQHFESFQEHVMANPPNKVLEVDEFLALRKEVKSAVRVDAVEEVDNPDVPPGEDEKELNSDEETKAIRDRIVSIRRKIHKATVAAVQARWNYEEGIKRPYFHVKPLERCQLKNWQDYLDYEIEQGDKNRIIVLFERCLIACALYEEFWLRFVNFLNGLKDVSLQAKMKDVFERACTIHHLKKPVIHLQWAMFEESVRNYNKAAEILQNLDKTVPNILQVAYRRINLERRRGDFEKCSQLYEHYINNSKNKSISTNLAIKYARFLVKLGKNHEKAIEVLNGAVTKDPNNSRLYLQLIDLSMHKDPIVETEVLEHINAFLDKEGHDADQKLTFAQRKLEFLEDFGSDIALVQQAYEDYQKYVKLAKDKKKDSSSKNESSKKSSSSTSQQQSSGSSSSMTAAPTQYGGHHGGGGSSGGAGGGGGAYNYHQSAAASQQQQQQQQYQHYQQQHQQQPQQQYGGQGTAGATQYAQGYNQQGGGDQQYAQQYGGWQYPNSGYGGYNQWGTGYSTYGY